ncbi:MAG: polyprenyl synthetase family protein [Alistipes sp.]
MITLDLIRKPISSELEEFEAFVKEKFSADGNLLSEMLQYALSSRGKAIRPMLVLLSASMNLPTDKQHISLRTQVAAMLVEMIHVASLIHDDVIDESDTRRGKPSPNARWQSRNAVILGDYILARNMSVGMSSGQFDIVTHVCSSIATLCEGEIYQSDCARRQVFSRTAYLDIIHKKTASLMGISASAGALSVGAPREKMTLMRHFGESIGMAFQIQDDILDYARTSHTGKPANNDLREGKVTLPLLVVLEHASAVQRTEILAKLALCPTDDAAVEWLQTLVEQEKGVVAAAQVMNDYLQSAKEMLTAYEDSPYRKALLALCDYIAKRDR